MVHGERIAGLINLLACSSLINSWVTGLNFKFLPNCKAIFPILIIVQDLKPLDSFNAKGVLSLTYSKKSVTCGAGSGSMANFSFKFGISDTKPLNSFPLGPSI